MKPIVGIILPSSMDLYCAELAKGIEDAVSDAGFYGLIGFSHEDSEIEIKLLKAMFEADFQGVIVVPAGINSATATVLTGVDAAATNASAAADAAAEATDAANAATDAANAAAEAADAATAAAQDAADAVAALSAQVATLVASIKAQITSLTKLIVRIQKKVKA